MRASAHRVLLRTTRWRLTLLNAAVLSAILLLLAGFLYEVELTTTDAELTQLLTHTVQQEQEEDLVQILSRPQPTSDPPRPFSPAALQTFFLLVDTHEQLHEGEVYRLPGLPAVSALSQVWRSRTPDLRDMTIDGFHLRLLTVPILSRTGTIMGALQVYVSLQARDAERERLLFVLLISSGLGIGLSVLAACFLASHALAPMWRAFEQQEQFVADASHELRAPLTLLQADVEILKRALRSRPVPQRTREQRESAQGFNELVMLSSAEGEVLDEMEMEIIQMSTLMTDLLTLARYDAGVRSLDGQPVALAPLLMALVARLETQLVQAHLTLHLLLPEDLYATTVGGDPSALRRLFLVLLHNAITYTPAGGQIWLEVHQAGGRRVAISVRDTGRGIAACDLPHLFKRFYRVDKARTRQTRTEAEHGTGLGLSIAQGIVQRHGGNITASSPGEGQGSTFTVLLKLANQMIL